MCYLNVLAVVVDVFLWRMSMFNDVIIVSVVDDENTPRFHHGSKMSEADFVVPKIE